MNKVEDLRTEFKKVSKRLELLVQKMQDEQRLVENNTELLLPQSKVLSLTINIYDSRAVIGKISGPSRVSQEDHVEVDSNQPVNHQRENEESSHKIQKDKEFKDQFTQTEMKKEDREDHEQQAIMQDYRQVEIEQNIKVSHTQQQNSQAYLFNDSLRHFIFNEKFNLTPEPLSKQLSHSRFSDIDSLNYSKTHQYFTKSPLTMLNKRLGDSFMKLQRIQTSNITMREQNYISGRSQKKYQTVSSISISKRQSKSQSIIKSSVSCHNKCKQLSRDSQLIKTLSKSKIGKLSISNTQEQSRTQFLISEIRKYLDFCKLEKDHFRQIADRNKSYATLKINKLSAGGSKTKARLTYN